MNDHDPYDVLVRAASRDRAWQEPVDLDEDTTAAVILRRVFDGAVVIPLHRRRRRRLIAGTVVIGIVAAGSAVAASTWTRQAPSTVRALACWNEAPLGDEGVIIGTRFGDEDPVDTCRAHWERRDWDDHAATDHLATADLVTCVADYGTAVVIPGADETACDDAGLARFDGRIAPEVFAVRDLEDEFREQSLAGICLDDDTVLAALAEGFERYGLDDWTAEPPEQPVGDDDCAVVAFDEVTSTAFLLPMPRTFMFPDEEEEPS